jgi:hypothetical protein
MFMRDAAKSESGRGIPAHAGAAAGVRVRFLARSAFQLASTARVRGRLRMVRRAFVRFMRPLECFLCRSSIARTRNARN